MIARACALAGALLLFPIQAWIEGAKLPSPNIVEVLPPPSVLPILASGHRETVADLLEIKAVTFALGSMNPGADFSDEDRDHLFLLYRGVLALDPDNVDAAVRGSILLAAFGWRSDASAALLQLTRGEVAKAKGREIRARVGANPAHPRYWKLYYEEAGICISMRANEVQSEEERQAWVRRAGELWVQAADHGGPEVLREVGERLARLGLSQSGLIGRELALWGERYESAPKELKPAIERRVMALQTRLRCVELTKWVVGLAAEGRVIKDVRELPLPPEAIKPVLGEFRVFRGRVIAPEAEAELLRQGLNQALTQWREAHPGLRPTLADLGWVVPPLAPPLAWNPVFRHFGWLPAHVEPPQRPGSLGRARELQRQPWWEQTLPPLEEAGTLGLSPEPYLSYALEGDAVQVFVRPE